jgi:hypothetical protein
MKKTAFPLLLVLFFISLLFKACSNKDEEIYVYEANVPVYMDFATFRGAFRADDPKEIKQAGKIYFKDNYLFINEVNEGIHVIDNRNPSYPTAIAFYEIPGNVDMAIRGEVLFADSYIDLLSIDISDIHNPKEISRIENAFPQVMPFPEEPYPMARVDMDKGVIVGWEVETIREKVHSGSYWWWGWRGGIAFDAALSGGAESAAGIAGSMARFMLHQHYLYAITNPYVLKTLDISDASNMQAVDSISTWRNMETLFRVNANLFIGTTTGMLIYDLTNPAKPEFISDFDHVNSCDPVVVYGDIAYVTLRSGNACNGFSNQLDVIDISNIERPSLLKSYPMFNPHGLGIDYPLLFICDGADGLKVYDVTNPLAISSNRLAHFPGIDTYDVIPYNDVLMLIGHDGLFQYDYSDPANIKLLSHLNVGR